MAKKLLDRPRRRGWIALFVAITLVVVSLGYAYYAHETERVRRQKYDEIAAISKLKAESIHEWRKNLLENVRALSKGPLWRRAVNEWFQDPTNDALLTVLRDRLLVEQQRRYADALLLNPDGNVIVSASGQPDSIDAIEKKAIEEAVASDSVILTDMYRTHQGAIRLDVAAPILDTNGRPMVIALYRINPESSLFPLIQSWPTPSQTAESLLVRRDGDDVLFLNDLRHRANTALYLREPLTLQDLPAVQAVTGKTGLFQGKDYRKVDVLADLRPIPDSPWFMVAKVDTSEILAEAHYRGAVVVIFSGLFILLTAGFTAYGYRNRQAKLYENLYHSEQEQREAQELFRTTLYSIGDAVITTDTGGLVQQMNPVAERLTGWQEAEAKGKSLDKVFYIVQEESRAPVENPAQRVLTEGKVVGLANHTLLISRDGVEFPIADSGAPIRSNDGSILGVVLVFRDQTEERAAQEALRRANLFTNTLLENLLEGVVACDADGALVLFNKMSREWHGLDPIAIPQEQWADYYDLYCADGVTPMTLATVPLARAFRGEELRNEGMLIRAKGRPDRHIVANCAPFFDEKGTKLGAVGVMHDITDRKRAEDDLRETRAILQVAMDQSQAGIAIADAPDGKLRYLNNAGLGIRGGDQETIVDSVGIDQYVGTWQLLDLDGTPLKSDDVPLARAIMYGETNTREFMIRNSANENRIVWANAAPVKDDKGQVKAGIVVFLDITERKQTEKALRESEQRHRSLIEHLPQHIFIKDRNSVYLSCNKNYASSLGIAPEQIVGKDDFAFHSPELAEAYRSDDQTCMTTGLVKDIKEPYLLQGQERWAHTIKVPYRDGQGRIIGVLGIFEDITEQKLTAVALKRERDQAQMYLDIAGVMLVALNADGNITMMNRRGCEILGYREDEIIGKNWSDVCLQADLREEVKNVFEKLMAGEIAAVEYYENPVSTKDGEQRILEFHNTVLHDESGRIVGIFSSGKDVTERKKAEEDLKSSETRYRQLADVTFEGIIFHDEGVLLQANDQFFQMFGYEPDELIGTQIIEKTLSLDSLKTVRAKIAERSTESYVAMGLRKNGTTFPIEIRARIREVDGKQIRATAIRDLSMLKNLEAQLLQAQKMEAIGTLAGGIAHDFNNLLQTVLGYAEFMLQRKKQGENDYNDLQKIYQAGERGAALVKSLMTFSRKIETKHVPVDLNQEITSFRDLFLTLTLFSLSFP